MRWLLQLSLAANLGFSATAAQEPVPQGYEGAALDAHREAPGVVWSDATQPSPVFVPANELLTINAQLRPEWFKRGGLAYLQRRVDEARAQQERDPASPCLPLTTLESIESFGMRTEVRESSASAWLERVRRSDVTVTGRVTALTPGLDWRTASPATLVAVRVDSLLWSSSRQAVRIGDIVTYISHNGEIVVSGTRFCVTDPAESTVHLGDRVLIMGWLGSERGIHLTNRPVSDVLRVSTRDRVTLPSPNTANLPLSALAQQIKALPSAQPRGMK